MKTNLPKSIMHLYFTYKLSTETGKNVLNYNKKVNVLCYIPPCVSFMCAHKQWWTTDAPSQQVSRPPPPSCSPGTAHWWHQLVWKWPLVPPHHCGTNIAAQSLHQTLEDSCSEWAGKRNLPRWWYTFTLSLLPLLLSSSHFSHSLAIKLSLLRPVTPYGCSV